MCGEKQQCHDGVYFTVIKKRGVFICNSKAGQTETCACVRIEYKCCIFGTLDALTVAQSENKPFSGFESFVKFSLKIIVCVNNVSIPSSDVAKLARSKMFSGYLTVAKDLNFTQKIRDVASPVWCQSYPNSGSVNTDSDSFTFTTLSFVSVVAFSVALLQFEVYL